MEYNVVSTTYSCSVCYFGICSDIKIQFDNTLHKTPLPDHPVLDYLIIITIFQNVGE